MMSSNIGIKWILKGCPRCKGDLNNYNTDEDGNRIFECLQCGYQNSVKRITSQEDIDLLNKQHEGVHQRDTFKQERIEESVRESIKIRRRNYVG